MISGIIKVPKLGGPRLPDLPLRLAFTVIPYILLTAIPGYAGFDAGDMQHVFTAGVIPGNGDNEDVNIYELRAGMGHYFRDRLGFYTELSIYRPTGEREGISVNTTGLGVEFAVRWHFWEKPLFSLYADWGIGFMGGLDPFPPMGTRYNATPHFGIGLSACLKQHFHFLAGIRQLHMSNGKGVVEANPSFDGLGAYLGIAFKSGFKNPIPPLTEPVFFGDRDLRFHVDATVSRTDDNYSPGGTVAADFPLFRAADFRAQIAYSAAELVGQFTWEAAFHVYRETPGYRLSLGYARKEFSAFTSGFYRFQAEHILNDVSKASFLAGLERKNLADYRVFGGLFVTVYPADSWALRSGIAFERRENEFLSSLENVNDAGFNFGVEWSPGILAEAGLSLFLQSGIGYDEQIAGIRFQAGGKRSLRERHQQGTFIPMR